MRVVSLHRYPVKSMGGQAIDRARVDPIGIEADRRWMIVNEAGRFLTRRELPRLAQIEALPHPEGIMLRNADAGELLVSFPASDAESQTAKIWNDSLSVRIADAAANDYVSAVLRKPLRLAYQPAASHRPIDPDFGLPDEGVSLADGFPILVTTEESLAALNAQLAHKVGMDRFRPSIVIAGATAPWAEDRWRRIRVGGLELRIVKPCARCVMTTQDPATGAVVDGNEPLSTLRAMGRQTRKGIIFGQNAIPDGPGEIAVGDPVEIVELGESNLVPAVRRNTALG